jgi:hypothetical protein
MSTITTIKPNLQICDTKITTLKFFTADAIYAVDW